MTDSRFDQDERELGVRVARGLQRENIVPNVSRSTSFEQVTSALVAIRRRVRLPERADMPRIMSERAPYLDVYCHVCGDHVGNVDTREPDDVREAAFHVLMDRHIDTRDGTTGFQRMPCGCPIDAGCNGFHA